MSRNAGPEPIESRAWDDGARGTEFAAVPDLPYVRLTQRVDPPRDRRRIIALLAVVLLGHVLLVVWWLWATPTRRIVSEQAIEVRFFETSNPPAPPPLLPPPPLVQAPTLAPPPVRIRHPIPRAPDSLTATMESPPRQLQLYGPNGQLLLPQGGPPASAPAYREVMPTGDPVLTIKTPLHYKPTRFNKDWAPVNQTNGRKLLNKVIDKTSVKKTVKLPTGDRVTCAVNPLLALVGGLFACHGEIPPPPKNDHDIRLSLPPAETLTGKKVVVPTSASSAPPPASGE